MLNCVVCFSKKERRGSYNHTEIEFYYLSSQRFFVKSSQRCDAFKKTAICARDPNSHDRHGQPNLPEMSL